MKQQNNKNFYKAALYCRLSKDDDDRIGDSSSIQTFDGEKQQEVHIEWRFQIDVF